MLKEPRSPFHKSSYEQFLLYKFAKPVLNYRSNEFIALTNLCEAGPCLLLSRTSGNICCTFRFGLNQAFKQLNHALGCGFLPRPGHTNDHHINGTNCIPAWHSCIRVGVWQCSYWDVHLKDYPGFITRVGYCIPFLPFYLVLHGRRLS